MSAERLQKILARAGIASRRKAEAFIVAGRVRVEGRIVRDLGTRADPDHDDIRVDGRRIHEQPRLWFLLNKPRGYIASRSDPEGRPTILSLFRGVRTRLYPVGRLPFHASGVLLLTNQGDLAERLLREAPQVYALKIRGAVGTESLERLRRGLEVTVTRTDGPNTWLEVTVRERTAARLELAVQRAGLRIGRVARIAFAGLTAEGLRPGQWRPLTEREIGRFKMAKPAAVPVRPRPRGSPRNAT